MKLKVEPSFVISVVALLVSIGGFAISYFQFSRQDIPPEIFVRAKQISFQTPEVKNPEVVGETVLIVDFSFAFSITNKSSRPLFVVSCAILGNGVHVGAGSLGDELYGCEFEGRNANGRLEPGETGFFDAAIQEDLHSFDFEGVVSVRGWRAEILNKTRESPDGCGTVFRLSDGGGGYSQSCDLFENEQLLYTLYIQTGNGEIIRRDIKFSPTPSWPWGRLEYALQ